MERVIRSEFLLISASFEEDARGNASRPSIPQTRSNIDFDSRMDEGDTATDCDEVSGGTSSEGPRQRVKRSQISAAR
jgi:hypothetical protein